MAQRTTPKETLRKLRVAAGLSQGELAERLGVKSRSVVCEIERDGRASLRTALAIEKWTEGKIRAHELSTLAPTDMPQVA